jgi:hypothetical protein
MLAIGLGNRTTLRKTERKTMAEKGMRKETEEE